MQYLIIYLLAFNLTGWLSMWIDKKKARKNKWRISENTLLGIALLGGSFGSLIGMYMFHHKTQKLKFKAGIPFIILLQIFVVIVAYRTFPDF